MVVGKYGEQQLQSETMVQQEQQQDISGQYQRQMDLKQPLAQQTMTATSSQPANWQEKNWPEPQRAAWKEGGGERPAGWKEGDILPGQQQQPSLISTDPLHVQIHKDGGPVLSTQDDGVFLERRARISEAELRAVEEKIAFEKNGMIDAARVKEQAEALAAAALRLSAESRKKIAQAQELEGRAISRRDEIYRQEFDLEKQRAEAHERTVNTETLRASAHADVVAFEEQAKEAERLAKLRTQEAHQADRVRAAHELALREAERRHVLLLEEQSELSVIGEAKLSHVAPSHIDVQVTPEFIAEVPRLAPVGAPQASLRNVELHETLPTGAAPIHVAAEHVSARSAETRQIFRMTSPSTTEANVKEVKGIPTTFTTSTGTI